MRGDIYEGWFVLAGDFPASINNSDDPAELKPFESPACYSVDCRADGFLKKGTIITGSSKPIPTKTIGASSYRWIYNRVWRAGTTRLTYGATYYDTVYVPQGRGFMDAAYTIVDFLAVFGNDMLILTASGSHLLNNATARQGQFVLSDIYPEVNIATSGHALTMNGIPHFANAKGVFSWSGRELEELTRPVRYSLGSFVGATLTADFAQRFLVGGTAYVIDIEAKKLFDYSQAFLWTSKTLASKNHQPFQVDAVAINFVATSDAVGTLEWQSKAEDLDWYTESPRTLMLESGQRSRIELPIENGARSAHKWAMRLNNMPDNMKIRSIEVMVRNFSYETPTE